MGGMDPKQTLHAYLRAQRDAVLWKLDGVPERDQRMPMTTSGTNLLGLVKHLAGLEREYFGACLGRATPTTLPDEPNADMWATAAETPAMIVAAYRRAADDADAAIAELPLDTPATVPARDPPGTTPHRLLVRMPAATARPGGGPAGRDAAPPAGPHAGRAPPPRGPHGHPAGEDRRRTRPPAGDLEPPAGTGNLVAGPRGAAPRDRRELRLNPASAPGGGW